MHRFLRHEAGLIHLFIFHCYNSKVISRNKWTRMNLWSAAAANDYLRRITGCVLRFYLLSFCVCCVRSSEKEFLHRK